MALRTVTAITRIDPATARLTWTGGTGYVYVDGRLVADAATSPAEIPVPDGEAVAIEVHSAAVAGETIHDQPPLRPDFVWSAVSTASRYRIYHTAPGGSEEILLEVTHESGRNVYTAACPEDLAGGWHLFRIEAVTSAGIESTVDAWAHYVQDLPDPASDLALSGSGGTFTLTVTA